MNANFRFFGGFVLAAIVSCQPISPPVPATETREVSISTHGNPSRLPMSTAFKGEAKFHRLLGQARAGGWASLPIGLRTRKFAEAMQGTPYQNYTLEVDDHIETPVVNFDAMDCWTYYENALALARLIVRPAAEQTPQGMLRMIELERYRDGHCTGSYGSRMHHLEEVFQNNQERGLAVHLTAQLPGATRIHRNITEMQDQWRAYRYLRSNPELRDAMAALENRVSNLPVFHVPTSHARHAEPLLRDGDVCAITTTETHSYTIHVGLIIKRGDRAIFAHASSQTQHGRQVILDKPITEYLKESNRRAGFIICRPVK